jgi:hypothetical protein
VISLSVMRLAASGVAKEHQNLVEQTKKIKAAGRNRVWWAPGPAKPIDDHVGPHYATFDGRPYGSSRTGKS